MFNKHSHLHVGYLRTVLAARIVEIRLSKEVSTLRSKNCELYPPSNRLIMERSYDHIPAGTASSKLAQSCR